MSGAAAPRRRHAHERGAGRRAADVLAASRHPHGRSAIWAALRRTGGGTVRQVSQEAGAPERTVRSYLQALVFAGLVTREEREGAGATFALRQPAGAEPPRLRADGKPSTQGSGRDRLWRTMKMLRQFGARDLAVAASLPGAPIGLETAKEYVGVLAAAGYLAVVQPATRRTGAVYRLVRNTGPQPPQIQRTAALFDPNLGQVVWRQGAAGG